MRTNVLHPKAHLRRISLLLAAAVCFACVSFAQVHRQAVHGRPLATPASASKTATLIEKQMLDSRKFNPSAGISAVTPLPSRTRSLKTSATANVPEVDIYATILEDNASTTNGLYSIPSTGGEFTRITYGPFAQNGGVYQNGYYFYSFADTYWGMMVYYSFLLDGNQKNWPQAKGGEQNDATLCASAMANNPVTNKVYGCFYTASGNGYELGELDIQAFTRTTICSLDGAWSACGFSSDGTLYAILANGDLAKVSLTDGSLQTVGSTGLPIDGPTSGTIDYRTDTFFYATNADNDHAMYVIDLATAQATKLFDLPNEAKLGGMFIKYPNIAGGAPAAVSDMELNFTGASLSGTVDFTAPSTTFEGAALSGSLTYEVSINDNVAASGNCTAGEHTSAPLTLNEAGNYSVSVSVKNDAGASDPVKKTRWIGQDIPSTPQNVTLTITGDVASLSWESVTTGAHGGYINPDEVIYSVTRQPQGIEVATAQTATTFTETIPDPGTTMAIYYEVKAHAGNCVSEPGASNPVNHGHITPPYTETFDNANVMNTFTIIDANNDGATWSFNYDKVQAKFNTEHAMDDWLITSPIALESGKFYDLTIDVRELVTDYGEERFEVKLGTAPTAEAMTVEIIGPTDVTSKEYTRYAGRISVTESGNYYVGIHGISPADRYYMYVDNLAISAPYEGETPNVATDFKVTPDYDGRIRGTVSFKAPTVSTKNNPLTGLMDITVSRNDQVVHNFGSIQPGAECTFEDIASEIGEYRYTVVATNADGTGSIMAATARLGVNLAPAPLNPAIEETEEGTVKLTWESPAKDINGFPLNPDAIRYAILDRTGQNVLAENLRATEFTFEVREPGSGDQNFVFYYILPQTDAGVNYDDYTYTDQIPVGTAYTYPFAESFAGGKASHAWAITRLEATSGSWGIGPASQQPVASPQDGDGGLAAFMPTAVGDEALFHSGKIQVPASALNPQLSFWYFGVDGLTDRIDVMVADQATGEFTTIGTRTLGQEGAGWHRVVLPLTDYKGKTIRIGFYGVSTSYSALGVIDNIKVTDVLEGNLRVAGLRAPARMTAGAEGSFTASIENCGISDAADVKVSLMRDGETVATKNIASLGADKGSDVMFSLIAPVFGNDLAVYTAALEWSADTYAGDNVSEPVTVKMSEPALPRVTDLAGTAEGSAITLTWSEPAAGQEPGETLESFENATPFEIDNVEGWTFVDRDGKTTFGIEGVTFPNNGKPMAYMVIDRNQDGFNGEFEPRSGERCLVSFNADDSSENDNWAISPLLNGKPQTIRFAAKAQTTAYGYEAFEFLYSTQGTDPDSFIKAGDDKRVADSWKEYSFDVPQGAKHFAIRCVSKDAFAFLVDDVMFTPAALPEQSAPISYNLYRDTELLSGTNGVELNYTDTLSDEEMHSYHVTALYPHGESAPSNEVNISTSALQAIAAGEAAVYTRAGQLWGVNVTGVSVSVFRADGTTVFMTETAADGLICTLTPGVYLVKAGTKTYKVLVP